MKLIEKKIFRDYSLKNLTTIKVGGNAELFGAPSSVEEVIDMFEYAYKIGIEPFILGGGSNCIFGDNKISRFIISTKNFKEIKIQENKIIAGAGVLSSEILNKCEEIGLSGLEFTIGVPASTGGMIYMNYGSMGKEISQYLTSIIAVQKNEVKMVKKDEINFSYRKGYRKGVVVLAEFELEEKSKEDIKRIKKEFLSLKKQNQPLDKRTAGCIFKNPPGNFAGKLIDEVGLKGFQIGDAIVSRKHANFIENKGKAKFADIKLLIEYVKEKVYEKFNIKLKEEVIIIEK